MDDKPVVKKKSNRGGYRPGSGRPEFVPTEKDRQTVEAMSGYGVPQEEIAALIGGGISIDTLAKHFAVEIEQGRAKANAQVSKRLFHKAVNEGDTASLIWWTKSRMRWTEKTQVEHTGTVVAVRDFTGKGNE